MKYRHLFFDLDHTLWDFNANARLTLAYLYEELGLEKRGVTDFDLFYTHYLVHNDRIWARYRSGFIKAEELRWKRMWHTLLEFRIGDEKLARHLGARFLDLLPSRNLLFADAVETLRFLKDKGYVLHVITNGFETTQHHKLINSGISPFFTEVITSEASNSLKPKKEIFEFALKKANAVQQNSIMLGDSPEADIQGAINAGIDQVFINHENIACDLTPTYTVRSLHELRGIF